ncbi:preprotein translocase subunit YajC [Lentilactobacillus buchneri]|nr:preprotein translocase, YajC subunit [Lentilactobacillus buchneri NRRL B-30929]KRK68580.1 preprotein translocase subunit YajC [Lentilactobacillus buchneri DSM 20057]MCT2882240.1 preprotein translocase subunit YajC [Lentilactobacillus buchneri]MCT2897507.1 preprotein translocase subunit YajC [Lentilactobacillus buchneri]MCT3253003.1 preprotein translocase subunit YajC [Lentilactobacillus buchneri]
MNQSYYSILMIVVLFAVMYFLMIRPQRKQQQKRRDQLSKIKEGDQVITIGRLHGVVDEINEAEKTVTLDCDGIYLVFDLSAIASVKQPAVAAPAANNDTTTTANDDHKDDAASSKGDQDATEDSDTKDETKSEDK